MSASVREMRRNYLLTLAKSGEGSADVAFGFLPQDTRDRWKVKFLTPQEYVPSNQRRYLNHFMLGADPEFVFTDADGENVPATHFNLKTGLAFGADQNGRLVEMRPAPSRSALEVTASVLAELRWMARLYPMARPKIWQSGAYLHGDGLGGHIHFGRKRPTAPGLKRKNSPELLALDHVGKTLYDVRVFPNKQWDRRLQPDEHGNHGYGHYGDFRPQVHGYEYRTLPSWLDSPWLAYLCFVLSKLAVHHPGFVLGMQYHNAQTIHNLLAYFKGRDDDALLAFTTLKRIGLPVHRGDDFKARWGLTYSGERPPVTIVPTSIKPCAEDIEDLTAHFLTGQEIPARDTKPTWAPVNLPTGFRSIIDETDITRKKGLGELVGGLCYHQDFPVIIRVNEGGGASLMVSRNLQMMFPKDWPKRVKKIMKARIGQSNDCNCIYVSHGARDVQRIQQTKQLLLSGLFPLWRYRDANIENVREFAGRMNNTLRGKILS